MKFLRTLEVRLSLANLALVFVVGGAQFLVLYLLWQKTSLEAEQKIHWGAAEGFAIELRPLVKEFGERHAKVREKMHALQMQHRDWEIYLIDETGKNIQDENWLPVVAPKRIKEFLTPDPNRSYPLYAGGYYNRDSIFSVAPIASGEGERYVFVDLFGSSKKVIRQGVGDRNLIFGSLLILLLVCCMSVGLGFVLFRLLTRRLRNLIDVVGEYRGGKLDERAEVVGHDDIAVLSKEFNRMAATIAGNISELERNDRERRDLVSHIAHDFGAPVSSIRAFLEAIEDDRAGLTSERKNELCKSALRSTEKIQKLCRSFLELAKLDIASLQPSICAFSISEIISMEVFEKFQGLAEQQNARIIVEIPEDDVLVLADPDMCERILDNLVENAIRYGGRGGTIFIKLDRLAHTCRVSVSDNGPGIAEVDQKSIFDRFYRGESAHTLNSEGSGIGLTAVRMLVEAQGSKIELESKLGEGSRFSFELPLDARMINIETELQ